MKKTLLILFITFIGLSNAVASHLRAGEITYEYIGDIFHPYKYRILITTYTKWLDPSSVDNCQLTVHFGDGDTAIAPRINGGGSSLCPGLGIADGEFLPPDSRKNIYKTEHNYDGPGNYTIWMQKEARNQDIYNIPDSDNQFFYLQSELIISPFLGPNNSPSLLNSPLDDACFGVCFEHNPGAYDADGDSLYYSLTACLGSGGSSIGWTFPANMNSGSIDPLSGDLVWCSPNMLTQYNIAILIKQYRFFTADNKWYYIGSVLRDMQITVKNCLNTPPQINHVNDTCVIANTNLNFVVNASDAQANTLTLTATGGPFMSGPSATFTSTPGTGTATGTFSWTPNCSQVQLMPYMAVFKAKDGDPATPLVNFESVFIRVIAPPVIGLTATPGGTSIFLNWDHAMCDTLGSNPLKKYFIYRKNSCDPWQPSPCETGVPAYTGYTLIGTNAYNDTTFTDNNGGAGLTNGIDYSYIIIAYYSDGSQSIASENVCAKLVRDVPIITNVSVMSTDAATGTIWTHWVKPIGTAANLDTIANPPPYEYHLRKASGFNPAAGSYVTEFSYTYAAYWQMTDTGFVSSGINTQDSSYSFKIDFYSNGILKGSSQTASSVFLSSAPGDKQVNLSWQKFVPWNNYIYHIFRETAPGSAVFNLIDSTATLSYVDTGLVNEVQYCYKILAIGEYSDTTLPKPLRNFSQVKCETPVDLIPPCQPSFNVVTDCDVIQNTITWVNPNTYCSSDAALISIYFAPTINDPLQVIYTTTDMNMNSYTLPVYYFEGVPSIAGCYAVTATDSALSQNESPIVNKICVDNCPEYELPNIFTPNNDDKNDFFTPLPHYRYVKDVDIKIYDRWGLLMFETTDPDVLWDGKTLDNKDCPNGVYFYVCTVNEIRIEGIKPRILKGFIHIIKDGSNPAR